VGPDQSIAHDVTGLTRLTGGPEKKKIISGFFIFFSIHRNKIWARKIVRVLRKI
jgi:hypothetical protein